MSRIFRENFPVFHRYFQKIGAFSAPNHNIWFHKKGRPEGRPSYLLAAATVVVAATAAAVVAAPQAIAATAAGEQDDQDDDPPAAVTAKTIVAHKEYLHEIFSSCFVAAHSMV